METMLMSMLGITPEKLQEFKTNSQIIFERLETMEKKIDFIYKHLKNQAVINDHGNNAN